MTRTAWKLRDARILGSIRSISTLRCPRTFNASLHYNVVLLRARRHDETEIEWRRVSVAGDSAYSYLPPAVAPPEPPTLALIADFTHNDLSTCAVAVGTTSKRVSSTSTSNTSGRRSTPASSVSRASSALISSGESGATSVIAARAKEEVRRGSEARLNQTHFADFLPITCRVSVRPPALRRRLGSDRRCDRAHNSLRVTQQHQPTFAKMSAEDETKTVDPDAPKPTTVRPAPCSRRVREARAFDELSQKHTARDVSSIVGLSSCVRVRAGRPRRPSRENAR